MAPIRPAQPNADQPAEGRLSKAAARHAEGIPPSPDTLALPGMMPGMYLWYRGAPPPLPDSVAVD